jgi:hypothetical protein
VGCEWVNGECVLAVEQDFYGKFSLAFGDVSLYLDPEGIIDCSDLTSSFLGGSYYYDCAEDCLGECGGDAVFDECGLCNGPGPIYECGCADIPEEDCDCDGNILDECGVCGGEAVEDCFGVCGGSAVIDECGVCDGSGAVFECEDHNDNITYWCDEDAGLNEDGCCGDDVPDCFDECEGDAVIDECGLCDGPGADTPCTDNNGNTTDWCSQTECDEHLLDVSDVLPTQLSLSQNYPNPFNPTTTIEYGVPSLSKTNISLYDLQGRRLKTLINSMHRPGYYTITLRLNDLQSGIYIVKIVSGNATKIRKIALVK